MGSRLTKVATTPHVKAAASPVIISQHHEIGKHTNEDGPHQERGIQTAKVTVNSTHPCDKISLEFTARTIIPSARRYSEPAQPAAMATDLNSEGIRHLDAFERFLAERELMAIDIDYAGLVSPIPVPQLPVPPLHVPLEEDEEPEVQCIACCVQLPKKTDPLYARDVIKPCKSCNNTYCVSCVKSMFLKACTDSTRMPARCCTQIHLHHVKTHLTAEEITEYRSKYEEWSTPKPFYCPVPTCSTFIPERLLSQHADAKGKRKVDSGIGTPNSPTFQCPKCEGGICMDCRQVAHPDSICANLDLGVDADTAALLKAWGYKRCPKCSQGLKRMYGCNHMECRCGAHFCWGCMQSRDACEGGCYESEDEAEDNDSEPDEPDSISGFDDAAAVDTQRTEGSPRTLESDTVDGTTALTPAPRPRNLDGGAAHYWEQQDLDFGEEPTDDVQDRVWECQHTFTSYTISLTEAISNHPSLLEMECVKCWCTVLPDIETPIKPNVAAESTKVVSSSNGRGRGHGGRGGRGRGNVARPRSVTYVPPRGLRRSDATIGTAPHLTVQVPHVPPSQLYADPMEGVQVEAKGHEGTTAKPPTSNVFDSSTATPSIAQECSGCNLLVCKDCADAIRARREAEQAARRVEFDARQAALPVVAAAAVIRAEESTDVPTSPSHDGHSPILLLD